MNLQGNTILITGGTSGIGLAFAEHLLTLGNQIIICGRRNERLEQIKEKHPKIIIKESDIADTQQRAVLSTWVMENYPDVNMLINNAGIQLLADLTKPVDLERIKAEVETNLVAPIHLTSLFSGHFIEKEHAAIINISSGLAFVPLSFMPVYCATKAAIHSFSLSLRHQLKNTPVSVFEIIPPSVDTELGQDRREDKAQSHGGMPVTEFMQEAIEALKKDIFEAPVGQAKGLRSKREELFDIMNP